MVPKCNHDASSAPRCKHETIENNFQFKWNSLPAAVGRVCHPRTDPNKHNYLLARSNIVLIPPLDPRI